MTNRRLATIVSTATLLTLGLALTGCSEPEDSSGPAPTISSPESTSTTAPTESAGETTTSPVSDDLTAAGLAALETAAAEAGGVAFGIDRDDDDDSWDVDVRTGSTAVEVEISSDGATVIRTENDDLDSDDAAALDAATITLAQAIEIAIGETGGVLDDAEISDDDGTVHWEVTVDLADRDDVDVDIDMSTGEVLRVD